MKKLLVLLLLSPLLCCSQGRQFVRLFPYNANNWAGNSFPTLMDTPIGYNTGNKSYPLLVFLHGSGEASGTSTTDPNYLSGKTLSIIYNSSSAGGPAYFIAHNLWPQDLERQFIVMSPQATGWSASGQQLDYWLQQVIDSGWRIDVNRIYLTGLSAGGEGLFDYTTHLYGPPKYPAAAIVPMSMAIGVPTNAQVAATLADRVHVWAFGSEADVFGIQTHLYITGSYGGNNGPAPPALDTFGRITTYAGGHCCWGQFYDPSYRLNGQRIYDWMLKYSRLIAPLALTYLALENKDGLLTWSVDDASEIDHFEIQTSDDGKNFRTVAITDGYAYRL